jgi:DNA adenine methylase
MTLPSICPACAPHVAHAPGECSDCKCRIESRPYKSEFVVRGFNKTYFRQRTGIGPMFGGTKVQAHRFATQREVADEMNAWPIVAVGCKVESVPPRSEPPLKPFLKWAGGKRQLLPELLKTIEGFGPFKHYYEPFVGGGALFFALRAAHPARERKPGWAFQVTLGDANERLIRTYLGVRNDAQQVIDCLKDKPYQKKFYLAERARKPDLFDDDSELAAWFIYLNKAGFNGLYRVNSKDEFNVPFGRYDNPLICDEVTLRACALALRGTKCVAGDFEKLVKTAERGDLAYFDPPYVPVNATSDFTSYTVGGFGVRDQERLRDCALRLKMRGVHVILSNADVPLVRRLYRGFTIRAVSARRAINSKATSRGAVGEVIIT